MLLKIVNIECPQPLIWILNQKVVDEILQLVTAFWTQFFMFPLFRSDFGQKVPALNKLFIEWVFLVYQGVY